VVYLSYTAANIFGFEYMLGSMPKKGKKKKKKKKKKGKKTVVYTVKLHDRSLIPSSANVFDAAIDAKSISPPGGPSLLSMPIHRAPTRLPAEAVMIIALHPVLDALAMLPGLHHDDMMMITFIMESPGRKRSYPECLVVFTCADGVECKMLLTSRQYPPCSACHRAIQEPQDERLCLVCKSELVCVTCFNRSGRSVHPDLICKKVAMIRAWVDHHVVWDPDMNPLAMG
jgi:hypothetical protein